MQQKISKFNGLFSILINIVPFLLFPALITQQGDLFTNILPFAIYYAFRRSALILFRDWEHQPRQLGWIGLISGAIGYGCGIFGQLSPLFLINATDSTVPWADAFTTAMSITGTWMLARKYLEQWFAWIMVDIVCVGLYLYKDIYPYTALYAVYTVVAVLGYLKWVRLSRQAPEA